jgi:hypothetical protein
LPPRRGAIGLIGQTVAEQSSLLAYIDVFRLFAIIAFALSPPAIFMLRANKGVVGTTPSPRLAVARGDLVPLMRMVTAPPARGGVGRGQRL